MVRLNEGCHIVLIRENQYDFSKCYSTGLSIRRSGFYPLQETCHQRRSSKTSAYYHLHVVLQTIVYYEQIILKSVG